MLSVRGGRGLWVEFTANSFCTGQSFSRSHKMTISRIEATHVWQENVSASDPQTPKENKLYIIDTQRDRKRISRKTWHMKWTVFRQSDIFISKELGIETEGRDYLGYLITRSDSECVTEYHKESRVQVKCAGGYRVSGKVSVHYFGKWCVGLWRDDDRLCWALEET